MIMKKIILAVSAGILVLALGFVLGDRAGVDMIRDGAGRMEVSAVFESGVKHGVPVSDRCLSVKRELDRGGRGRAFLNSKPVPLALLGGTGESLVDFHGQHEHQTLLKPSSHLTLLDRFAGLEQETEKIGGIYKHRRALLAKIESARMSKEERERLLDLYRYQLKDIEEAGVKPGEDLEIEARLPRIRNAGRLKTISEQAYDMLYSCEGAVSEKMHRICGLLENLLELDPALSDTLESLKQAQLLIADANSKLSAYKESFDISQEEIDGLISRLDKLAALKKKYGPDLKTVADSAENLKRKIDDLENGKFELTKKPDSSTQKDALLPMHPIWLPR